MNVNRIDTSTQTHRNRRYSILYGILVWVAIGLPGILIPVVAGDSLLRTLNLLLLIAVPGVIAGLAATAVHIRTGDFEDQKQAARSAAVFALAGGIISPIVVLVVTYYDIREPGEFSLDQLGLYLLLLGVLVAMNASVLISAAYYGLSRLAHAGSRKRERT